MFLKSGYYWPALVVLAVAPYLTGLHYEFVYDDHGVIVENPFFHEENPWREVVSLQTMIRHDVVDGQRPALIATYLVDRMAWGLWPPGYRITNLFFHSLVILLLGGFLVRLTGSRSASACAVLLFAWHPLLVEAVQSPSFREDILYVCGGMFLLMSACRREASIGWMAVGASTYALALLSKESAVVFPVLMVATWMLFPSTKPSRSFQWGWLAVVAVVTIPVAWLIFTGRPVQALGGGWNGVSFRGSEGLWSAPWLLSWTLSRFFAPFWLSIDYRLTPLDGPLNVKFLCGVLTMSVMICAAFSVRKRTPVISLGLLWAVVAFVPASNVVPLLNPAADRYAYGILPALSIVAAGLCLRFSRRAMYPFIALAVMLLSVTMVRLMDWKNDLSLWSSALLVEPASARAHTWLGILEEQKGNPDSAMDYYLAAERLNPSDVTPMVNRAILLGKEGNLDLAESLLLSALTRRPDHPQALANLHVVRRLKEQAP
ncbi:MAG TPA: hypothetical protein PJ991_06885 [Kiritimatiellia bacterium]|nr:hypothetical protein [Kiritimatiellia bacterium]